MKELTIDTSSAGGGMSFEQAALLARWLSGDRKGFSSSPITFRQNERGRWVWCYSPSLKFTEVWVPEELENEQRTNI